MNLDFPVELICEGRANVIVPRLEFFKKKLWDYAPSKAPVFYNPLMRVCRDVAVLALQSYQRIVNREISVSEPLAGCGVRGIRFAVEVEGVGAVYMNDINEKAYGIMRHNIQLNDLSGRVFVTNEDANLFLTMHAAPKRRFDFIDVDPFGSPSPHIDSAIRALKDGGLLALTATDMAALCGVYPRAAIRKYGGASLKTEYCHEVAMRLLAGCLAMAAAKHNIGIKVLFSHSTDHYIRLYSTVSYGARKADESLKSMGYILHCFRCFHREVHIGMPLIISSDRCTECGSILRVAGTLWLGTLANKEFCKLMFDEASKREFKDKDRVMKIISMVKDEEGAPITYYVVDKISDKIGAPAPPLKDVMESIRKRGYSAIRTHFHSRGIKTDAPAKVVVEAVRGVVSR